jgi:plasmid stabilization system protein ParE
VFERIAAHPLAYAILYDEVRRALLRRFPFAVYFVIDRAQVVVLGVRHQRTDPASRPRP